MEIRLGAYIYTCHVQGVTLDVIEFFLYFRFTFPSVFVVYMTITLMVLGKTVVLDPDLP